MSPRARFGYQFVVLLFVGLHVEGAERLRANVGPKVGEIPVSGKMILIDSVIRGRSTGLTGDPDAREIRREVDLFLAWRRTFGFGRSASKRNRKAQVSRRAPAQSDASRFEALCADVSDGRLPSPLCEIAARLKRDPVLEKRAQALIAALEKGEMGRSPAGEAADQGGEGLSSSLASDLNAAEDSPSESLAKLGLPVLSAEQPGKAELEGWLTGTEPKRFARLSEFKPLAKAMRKFTQWSQLSGIVEASLRAKECPNGVLLAGLGMKAEEFFPDITPRTDALRLYSRAAECGPDFVKLAKADRGSKAGTAASVFVDPADPYLRSHFRAGLLHLWNEDCEGAEKNLQQMTDGPPNAYMARSLYWRSYCAKKSGNKLLQSSLKGRVFRDHPLTVQGLVLGGSGNEQELERLSGFLNGDSPQVAFRSKMAPVLNAYVRTAEALMEKGEREHAADVLRRVEKRLAEIEPEFALYVSVLLSRLDDRIAQFRALSVAFKSDPSTLTRATLELFYPLHQFDILEKHKGRLDPFLAASLIRQESGFNVHARSPAGAMGLMQLMPATARRIERVSRAELLDPKTNIRLGVKFFSSLLDRFSGDAELALAAYNAGPERVDSWLKRYPVANRALFVDLIPFRETRDYVSLIARNYYWYQALYGLGPGRGRVSRSDNAKIMEKTGQWFPLFKGL
jgi:hypothetical protein